MSKHIQKKDAHNSAPESKASCDFFLALQRLDEFTAGLGLRSYRVYGWPAVSLQSPDPECRAGR